MADIFDLAKNINRQKEQASQGYSSGWEELPIQIAKIMQENKRLDMESKDAQIRRDAYILNNFEGNIERILEATSANDVKAIGNSKNTMTKVRDKFYEKYPQLSEDVDIIFNHANKTLDDGIVKLNEYSQDKFNLGELEKEQKKIIDTFSSLQSEDLVKDPKKMVEAKEDLLLFYNKLSSLGKSSPNYMNLGIKDYQDHATKIQNMSAAHSGILRNLDILNINEAILNENDIMAINYALQGDSSQLNEILTAERMTKGNQQKAQFNKITKGIESYNQANNLIIGLADYWDEDGVASGHNLDANDTTVYKLGEQLQIRDSAKEETQGLIDGYSPYDLQLRDFKTVHPMIDIPWEEKKDSGDNSFEDNMLMKEFNLSQEAIDKNRKEWETGGSEGEFTNWFKKNYKPTESNQDKKGSSKPITTYSASEDAQNIVKSIFDEVENPVDPRNPGSAMKSVTYTTSKKTQADIKEKYGRGALGKLHKLYQLKKKFGEDSEQYKKEFEAFEKYLEKQNKKKQPKIAPKPTQAQMDELNQGIIEYNKRFGRGLN